jgi:hypothetical protein
VAKRILVLLLLSFTSVVAQTDTPISATLKWKNVSSQYESFDQIKPVLVNDGKESIFLSRIYPHGSAQLSRFNEGTRKWEVGSWGIGCGVVNNATIPIEIKPQTERAIVVYWQLSTDDWDNPRRFVVYESLEERPLKGRYKFSLRYSMKPWTLAHRPGAIYMLESPEFQITQ